MVDEAVRPNRRVWSAVVRPPQPSQVLPQDAIGALTPTVTRPSTAAAVRPRGHPASNVRWDCYPGPDPLVPERRVAQHLPSERAESTITAALERQHNKWNNATVDLAPVMFLAEPLRRPFSASTPPHQANPALNPADAAFAREQKVMLRKQQHDSHVLQPTQTDAWERVCRTLRTSSARYAAQPAARRGYITERAENKARSQVSSLADMFGGGGVKGLDGHTRSRLNLPISTAEIALRHALERQHNRALGQEAAAGKALQRPITPRTTEYVSQYRARLSPAY